MIEQLFGGIVGTVSHLFDPIMLGLDRIDAYLRASLAATHVPLAWLPGVVVAIWVFVVFVLLRLLDGWWRALLIIVVALILAKVYGLLPTGQA